MLLLKESPYIVGVTGHMDLRDEEVEPLKERIETLFRFLLNGSINSNDHRNNLINLLKHGDGRKENPFALEAYERGLRNWPEFVKTPIVVMTSLAPGADTILAEVALRLKNEEGLNIHVIAPLPFHCDLYEGASTFKDSDQEQQRKNLDKYQELVKQIGEQNTFCVRMPKDEELNVDDFKAKCKSDRDSQDSKLRHDRYYAAGEYIAKYSHLMIAIWDHEQDSKTSSGTAAIVHARQSHSRFDDTQTGAGLNLPNGGPIFHLYTHRLRNNEASSTDPRARFLYCHPTQPKTAAPPTTDKANKKLASRHFGSLSLLTRNAMSLETFNLEQQPDDKSLKQEIDGVLTWAENERETVSLRDVLEKDYPTSDSFSRFEALARLRKKTTSANVSIGDKRNWTFLMLFWLAFGAALFIHIFAEWHPQESKHASHDTIVEHDSHAADEDDENQKDHKNNANKATGGDVQATDQKHSSVENAAPNSRVNTVLQGNPTHLTINVTVSPDNPELTGHETNHVDHIAHPFDVRRPIFGTLGLLFGLTAIAAFWWRRTERNSERAHDYRSLAEGLRVQMHWNLAGLGKSVPANYMNRQRNEFEWIRGVVRSASLPYQHWRDRFQQLSFPHRAMSIRCVLNNWVRKQAGYFERKMHERHYTMHSWHKLGGAFAIAGLCGFVLLTGSSFFDSHHPLGWLQTNIWIGYLLTLIFGLAVGLVSLLRAKRQAEDNLIQLHHTPQSEAKFWKEPKLSLFRLINFCLQTSEPNSTQHFTKRESRLRMFVNFLNYIVLGLCLAFAATTLSATVSILWPSSPNATIWSSIALGATLVAGALCVAWTEKQLDSEHAYQFSTMFPLFRAAGLRLEVLVEELENEAELISGGNQESEKFRSTLEEIRAILFQLGLEALDENAEWLILHRARPLEPVMAG